MRSQYSTLRGALTSSSPQQSPGDPIEDLSTDTQHSDDFPFRDQAHTADLIPDDAAASSPPSSSPVAVTPLDCTQYKHDLDSSTVHEHSATSGLDDPHFGSVDVALHFVSKPESLPDGHNYQLNSDKNATDPVFLQHLDLRLLAAQSERRQTCDATSHGTLFEPEATGPNGSSALSASTHTQKRILDHPDFSNKRRKISQVPSEQSTRKRARSRLTGQPAPSLFGAFNLCYANRPASLRRAESLKSDVFAEEVAKTLDTEASLAHLARIDSSKKTRVEDTLTPIASRSIAGAPVASPFDAYAPTVPTTPTANNADSPVSESQCRSPTLANIPVIAPPSFEYIPRGPLSNEEAAERRIAVLLEREREHREADGLHSLQICTARRSEDEEECFWTHSGDATQEIGHHTPLSPPNVPQRAMICQTPTYLDIGDALDEIVQWILHVMPDEEYKTSYSPGDLYDLLSTSSETRFHACYLFFRYFLFVSSPEDGVSVKDEGIQAVVWDVAVACLALSVKFHRDVLSPLEIVCAFEFLDIAPHDMEFEDLEHAQRDVLEAVSYCVGSATPGAFMDELWRALPTLRMLVGFDGGWEKVQSAAWVILCDALQMPELLRYPISLVTAAAVMDGIIDTLCEKFKKDGVDDRGRSVGRRGARSVRKVAEKRSRGVRLDIRDVLGITERELLQCQSWLGLTAADDKDRPVGH